MNEDKLINKLTDLLTICEDTPEYEPATGNFAQENSDTVTEITNGLSDIIKEINNDIP